MILSAVALSACSSVQGTGARSYKLPPGIATYDALRAATEQCAAQGGALDHRAEDSTEELSTYTCRIVTPGQALAVANSVDAPAPAAAPKTLAVFLPECASVERVSDRGAFCTMFQGMPVSAGLDPATRRERLLTMSFDPGFQPGSKDLATAESCLQSVGTTISQMQQAGDARLAAINTCFTANALSGRLELRIN